jgi:hypothetical protein
MTEVELDTDTGVYCKEGHCGLLHKVVVDQANERITDLIVEPDSPEASSRVVPVALVVDTDDEGVHLCICGEKLQTYPAYEDIVLET